MANTDNRNTSIERAGFELIISGNPSGPTVLFIHGWPDDASLFAPMADRLQSDFYCVRLTLPNFGRNSKPTRLLGPGFDEIVDNLRRLVEETQRLRNREGEPVSLVIHDWGCTIGYLFESRHPHLVKNVVALDIGAHFTPSVKELVMILAYQWYLIFCYVVGLFVPPLGNFMSRAFARIGRAPQAETVTSRMNFPYVRFWIDMFTRGGKGARPSAASRRRGMVPFPCLYLYGTRKPFFFHSRKWLEGVNKREDSYAQPYDAGHWFFLGKFKDDVNERVSKWLNERYAK